jgi:site-specific DNA-methyltransferase (adenine-specific)
MDPPDNIGLKYAHYKDNKTDTDYIRGLRWAISLSAQKAATTWVSFNSKWLLRASDIVAGVDERFFDIRVCVQPYTFYQHNQNDLGSGYRPLLRIMRKGAPIFPDAIRVESERQKAGDKRADPRGKVPSDVFDFPRVVGNSKQRRRWHPTQLHEGLVERCLLLHTPAGGKVLDLFGGTGTTSRVADRLGFHCDYIDLDLVYCNNVAKEFGIEVTDGY